MIRLLDILKKNKTKILVPRRSPEERAKNYLIATQKQIQQYIKDGGKGDLNLGNTPITSLPDNLSVGGDLDLEYTKITSLPDNLQVGGNLDLYNTPITSIPDNLKVGGYLYLEYTKITSLPDNLSVGGFLNLENTPITSLPDNLSVGGSLNLGNTPLSKKYTKEQIKQMIEDNGGYVKGNIYI
jgi:hypothetical protein